MDDYYEMCDGYSPDFQYTTFKKDFSKCNKAAVCIDDVNKRINQEPWGGRVKGKQGRWLPHTVPV